MNARLFTLLTEGLGVARTVRSTDTIGRAADELLASAAGAVAVCGDAGVVGLVTGRGLIRRLPELGPEPFAQPVWRAMTTPVHVVDGALTVREALRVLHDLEAYRLVVLDGGRFLGILSVRELSTWLARELERELNDLSRYICGPSSIPPPPPMLDLSVARRDEPHPR